MAKRVLICDDEKPISDPWVQALRMEGYEVREANQSLRFYDAVLEFRPDLIILDLLMPYLHGEDELQLLQMNPGVKDIPVVVVTAHRELVGNPDKLKALGVVEIWDKPVNVDKIVEIVKRVIG